MEFVSNNPLLSLSRTFSGRGGFERNECEAKKRGVSNPAKYS